MRNDSIAWLITILFALAFLPACGGSGSGGGGGNLVSPPTPIPFGQFVDGDLVTYREQIFTFDVSAGTYISVELYGIRLDQDAWNVATFNAPVISIYDDTIGNGLEILKHDVNALSWNFGHRDMEIPLYHFRNAGSYSLHIKRSETAAAGGPYKIKVNDVTADVTTQFGATLIETVDFGDTTATPEDLGAGDSNKIIAGTITDDDADFFAIDLAAPAPGSPLIACFEVVAQRNGMKAATNPEYQDLELTLYNLAEDATNPINLVDDAFFLDPQLCRKVTTTTPEQYIVSVNETSGADPAADVDYILKYTVEQIDSLDVFPEVSTDNTPDAIAYGNFVEGGTSGNSGVDWYSFAAQRGDMIRIRQFDGDLADDSTGSVTIELYDNVGGNLIPFDAPGLPGLDPDMTTTSLLAQASGTYYIKVTDENTASSENYSFIVEQVKTSVFEIQPDNNDTDLTADFFTVSGRVSGEIETNADVDFFEISATNLQTFGVTDGDLVAVHVYATRDVNAKAYELTGSGSSLEPELTIIDNNKNVITTAAFVQDSDAETTSEGIRAPYPTLTAVFVANPGTVPAYLMSIKNGGTYNNLDPSHAYLIELENLGK